jgi:hypothetical protein
MKLKGYKYCQTLLLLLTLLFTVISCDTTEPPIEGDNLQPGRRDYTWTVDTLRILEGRSYPSCMWGANASDVWAIGSAYLNAYQLWHYDGIKWENYVPNEYIDPRGICGFSANNIWTSSLGTSSLPAAFWHYNGNNWAKFCDIHNIEGYYNVVMQSIAGSAPNNIYAVGFADSIDGQSYKAIIYHFDGSIWKQVNIPNIRNSFAQIFYDYDTKKFIIYGWTFDTIIQYVYSFDGKNLKNIFSNEEGISLSTISNNIYASIEEKLYKYLNGNFNLFKDFSMTNYAGGTIGRSEKDFFATNWDGIGHYNGTDLITIYKKWNNDWSSDGRIVFEKDVFFIWDDGTNTFVIHGKLN